MCEAHIQDALDDIPQSDSDVVTPEKEKTQVRKTTLETYEKSFRGEPILQRKINLNFTCPNST